MDMRRRPDPCLVLITLSVSAVIMGCSPTYREDGDSQNQEGGLQSDSRDDKSPDDAGECDCHDIPEEPIVVLLLGDSITQGAISGDTGAPYHQVLAETLGQGFFVINSGCDGSSSLTWARDSPDFCGASLREPSVFEQLATPHLPADIVTIMLGTNDAPGFLESSPVPVAEFGEAMRTLVEKTHDLGGDTIILMTPPPRCADVGEATELLNGYANVLKEMCSDSDLDYVVCGPDIHSLLEPDIHFEECDVHPNTRGHELIGNALAALILDIVQR